MGFRNFAAKLTDLVAGMGGKLSLGKCASGPSEADAE